MRKATNIIPKYLIIIHIIIFSPFILHSQSIKISGDKLTEFSIKKRSKEKITIKAGINELIFKKKITEAGYFSEIFISSYNSENNTGLPALPVMRNIIEMPQGADIKINILSENEEVYYMPDYQINFPIFPAQASISKSEDAEKKPFVYNRDVYNTNSYLTQELISCENIGTMRANRLALLNFRPVNYNPVAKTIKVVTSIEFEIIFENPDYELTQDIKTRYASPFFTSVYESFVLNNEENEKSNLTQYPVKFVIVSDIMFQSALQPFIEWKTQKGFKVVEAYTNDPQVGNTTTSIKNYLQNLYNSATPNDPAFSFVLFVGDIGQVPSFAGTTGSHLSDLYYCEYTGDLLPEAYYGRFSANNITELQPQIDKTLMYEKYQMGDPAFLNESVLVSGVDASMAAVHGNGHINYITDNYINTSGGFIPHVYLYPASGSSGSQIIQNVSNGVGYANYTAHCSSSGWADPSFSTSDVAGLQNNGKYPFMIGNCCSSNDFSVNACFGEALLRAINKGAVGYIGGSNSTYWDEDFWWGVGYKTVVLNPLYSATELGAIDRVFHTHSEPFTEWFVTQGQINIAGNLAVQQSNSSLASYYWEIYHLMGDPSLMPYFYVPSPLTISYNPIIPIGVSTFTITTEPFTYVALSKNGVLHGAGLTDDTGSIDLDVLPFTVPGAVDIVATKQNKQPHISTITAIAPNGPYVIYNTHIINDAAGNNNAQADYGENIILNMTLKNVGNQTANTVLAKLKTNSTYVIITDSIHQFGNILSDATSNQSNAYSFTVNNFIPDQHTVTFTLEVKDVNDSTWLSSFTIVLNAPLFKINAFSIDDAGNNNTLLEPGEDADISIPTQNIGHAAAVNTTSSLVSLSNYITVNNSNFSLGNITPNQIINAVFSITADSLTPVGTPVKLVYTVSAGPYIKVDTITIIVGEIPVFNMKDTVITTCMAYFYDSGGATGQYHDDEQSVITFLPISNEDKIQVVFTLLDVEANTYSGGCWDELKVYNGTTTSAPLIGNYCGTNLPGPFIADNTAGALTFSFTSDYSVSQEGWAAEVSCLSTVSQNEQNINTDVIIFPNPCSDVLNIDFVSVAKEDGNLQILSITGAEIINAEIKHAERFKSIDVSVLEKGMYIVNIKINGRQIVKKLFIY